MRACSISFLVALLAACGGAATGPGGGTPPDGVATLQADGGTYTLTTVNGVAVPGLDPVADVYINSGTLVFGPPQNEVATLVVGGTTMFNGGGAYDISGDTIFFAPIPQVGIDSAIVVGDTVTAYSTGRSMRWRYVK